MKGERFGNYTVLSLLGEGGMGSVWLAEHPEIGRKVAVKVLREELTKDEGLLSRFLNEARAANAIRHPNIIEVLDGGRTPEGKPYMVMEFLEGESLSTRIGRLGRLTLKEALEFAYQASSALAAAHSKGIIHRDLKPDNLFVVADPMDPSRLLLKVLDFGIAKLQTMPRGDSFRTRTGTLMGTPTYMSPEQCLGTKDVDLRSDIYALGIILFEMLAGRPPFVSEGFGELVNMHINAAPPPLRAASPDVPVAVEVVVYRCLAKRPDDRFGSMSELQGALKTAAGSLRLGGRSSPNLDQTMALSETQVPASSGFPARGRSQATTMAGAAGEASAPRRRGFMIGGMVGLGALGALAVSFFFLRGDVKRADPSTSVAARSEGSKAVAKPTAEDGGVRAAGEATLPLAKTADAGGPTKALDDRTAATQGVRGKPVVGAKDASHHPHHVKREREDEPAKL